MHNLNEHICNELEFDGRESKSAKNYDTKLSNESTMVSIRTHYIWLLIQAKNINQPASIGTFLFFSAIVWLMHHCKQQTVVE